MKDDTAQESDLALNNGIPAEERLFMELSWDLGTARMAYEQMLKVERSPDTDDELDAELESIGADMRMGDALKRLSNRALELRDRVVPERGQDGSEVRKQGGPKTQEGSWRSVIIGKANAERML